MSATEDEIPQHLRDRVAASDFDRVVKFDCGADGIVVINKREVTREDMPADCVIKISRKNLEKLVRREIDPMKGFLMGKFKVEGDMSVALRLQTLL